MSLSQAAAGRARRVDGSVFFSSTVRQNTHTAAAVPSSPYAWKRSLEERIWSLHGPAGVIARAVLVTLVRHADATGRTWMSIATILAKTGIGSSRTVRKALDSLAKDGWLQVSQQTWASLTAEQTAAGRPTPWRDDVGQAPNMYVLLDGLGSTATKKDPAFEQDSARPGLVRATVKRITPPEPIDKGGPGQNRSAAPLAKPIDDLDPTGSLSMKVREAGAVPAEKPPHPSFENHSAKESWLDAWNLLVTTHAETTKARFGLTPSKPDVKIEQRELMAHCLVHAASEVSSKLRQLGQDRDEQQVRRDLAQHVMRLYFKHESEHLKRVKWALRDLAREIDARMIEAMQQMLREAKQIQAPMVSIAKPAPLTKTQPSQPRPAVDNAREAQRIIEMLERPTIAVAKASAPMSISDERS